jgi:hypothetical protein
VTWHSDQSINSEIFVRRWNGINWQEMGSGSASGGGISDNSGFSFYPSIALDPSSLPYIAWDDDSGGNREIYVRRWNGSDWIEIGTNSASGGGISNNSGISELPSIAVAPDGKPYVTWEDTSNGDEEIYVRRWNSSNWEEVGPGSASGGGISNNSGNSMSAYIAILPGDIPYVAWEDSSSGDIEIYVKRWLE